MHAAHDVPEIYLGLPQEDAISIYKHENPFHPSDKMPFTI